MSDQEIELTEEEENELSNDFERHQLELELEDIRMRCLYPIEYFDPETEKAWRAYKAGAAFRRKTE